MMKILQLLLLTALTFPLALAIPPSNVQSRIDAWIKGGSGGIAVAWVDADGAVFLQAGKLSAEDPRHVTPDTPFELGSVTKVFTALLLAESERRGKVSRYDPAAKYLLPGDDPAQPLLAKITLLSLTTHTSGLPRLPANIGVDLRSRPDNPYATYDRTALVEGLRIHGAIAVVGRSVSYSNFGVAVLGEALAEAWGTSYADALREHVLQPLGMNATTVGIDGSDSIGDVAPGHADGKQVPNWSFRAFAPAGGLRSSARDMALFLKLCIGTGDVPLRPAFDATVQPQFANEDMGGHIGLAWMLTDDVEQPIVWHNGATVGSHAFVAFSPKTGAGVAILANVQKGCEELGYALLGGKPSRPRVTVVANASNYVGLYPLTPTFAIKITDANGSLFAQATGQPRLALRPVSEDRFAVVGVPAELSFERSENQSVVALVLHQNGFDQRGARGELPPPPKEIELTGEALREYVGEYPLTPEFVLTVTEAGGALHVQATGQPKAQVFASSRDEFFYKVVDARLTFDRDEEGKISGLTLHQNGRELPAKKKP